MAESTDPYGALPLEYATPAVTAYDPISAIDGFFRQVGHRALSVSIWLLTARVVFAFWPRSFDFTYYILPSAFGCLDLALVAAIMSVWFTSRSRLDRREPREMLWVSLVLLVPTIAWMVAPRLVH